MARDCLRLAVMAVRYRSSEIRDLVLMLFIGMVVPRHALVIERQVQTHTERSEARSRPAGQQQH